MKAFRDRGVAKGLFNKDVPLEEIAETLGYDVEVIREWRDPNKLITRRKEEEHGQKKKRTRRRLS